MIDVPIAKDHSLARLTLGMKNLMGVDSEIARPFTPTWASTWPI